MALLLIIDRAVGNEFGARSRRRCGANRVDQLGRSAHVNGVTGLLRAHRDGIVALVTGPGDAGQAQDGVIGAERTHALFGFNQAGTAGTGGAHWAVRIDPAVLMALINGGR